LERTFRILRLIAKRRNVIIDVVRTLNVIVSTWEEVSVSRASSGIESELTQPRDGKIYSSSMEKVAAGHATLDGRRNAHGCERMRSNTARGVKANLHVDAKKRRAGNATVQILVLLQKT
jgi:hypothetical protein